MKHLSVVTFLAVLFAQGADNKLAAKADCDSFDIEFNAEIGLHVEKRGTVPTTDTALGSYNMDVFDNFDNDFLFFVNQKHGQIYSRNGDSTGSATPTLIFDAATSEVPAGLDLTWDFIGALAIYKVKAMTQGRHTEEVIIVFMSATLPDGWTEADAKLPPPVVVDGYACRDTDGIVNMGDLYRFDIIPACAPFPFGNQSMVDTYDVFYTFDFSANVLTNPTPFFVSESRTTPGHNGGGISTLPGGDILWATGDCAPYGMDGSYAPQLDFEACGKILKLNPSQRGEYRVVAKGVRNSQKMRVFEKAPTTSSKTEKKHKAGKTSKTAHYLAFMDIGGVTAEEVNAVPLDKLDSGEIPNFGWGRSLLDGKAREGTFYVNNGRAWVLGGEPSCKADQPAKGEDGFIQPWVQFGRTRDDFYFGISSMAIPPSQSFDMPLIWSEFNTGTLFGTLSEYAEGAEPAQVFKLKLSDNGGPLTNQLNSLVTTELGLGENDPNRGDPRLFHFPDGEIGVLMERTGVFYKLTQQSVVALPGLTPDSDDDCE